HREKGEAPSGLIPVRRRVDVADGDAEVSAGSDEHCVRSPGQFRRTRFARADTGANRLRTKEEVGGPTATHVHRVRRGILRERGTEPDLSGESRKVTLGIA